MRGLRLFICLIFIMGQHSLFSPTASAESTDGVVIAHMYPGATGTATQEFIELYNNSDVPIDVTNWCIEYLSSSENKQWDVCLDTPDISTKLFIAPHGYATFVSNELNAVLTTSADVYFDGGIYASRAYVQLVDAYKNIVDIVGWGALGDASYPAATKPANGKSLQRKSLGLMMQDTDIDSDDFIEADPLIHESDVYEDEIIVDVCPNIDESQIEPPEGYLVDESGDCQPDSCLNIEGLQVSVPDGYNSDDMGSCTQNDECDNLPEIQESIPEYMVRGDGNDCVIEYSSLQLTEVLPNAIGSDAGNEFIELYNAGNEAVDLTFYSLKIGINSDKVYSFPVGSIVSPGEYRTFSDSEIKFTLVNSSSKVVLTAIGGNIFGDTGIYNDADEGTSWALLDGDWGYTNRPTPDAQNLTSITTVDDQSESDTSSLKPCNPDQYRNPETNRCKKYATTTLAPCKASQYRNPETNRCRNVATANASFKPCAANQERNPATNRCRKKEAGSIPDAAYKVQAVGDSDMVFAGWWALGGVGALAGGYAGWEWRREMANIWSRLIGIFKK